MRRLTTAAGAIVLAAGLVGAGAGPASAEEPIRRIAVCEYRLCLLVLDESTDSDGDGVTDVDEKALGSDPRDPKSRPEAREIFDKAIGRQLPSFERHLTEMVALPRNTPDKKVLATGLGAIPIPDRGPLIKSVEDLMSTLEVNGFENLGTNMTVTLTRTPLMSNTERLVFSARGNVALYGSVVDGRFTLEGILGATTYGANGGKTPTDFIDRGFGHGDGGSVDRDYSVGYDDGSRDDVSGTTYYSQTRYSDGVTITDYGVTSYEGSQLSGHTSVTSSSTFRAESGGFSTEQVNITVLTTGYDENGNVTGSGQTTSYSTKTTYSDGSSKSYTKTTTTNRNKDGEVTGETTVIVEETCDAEGKCESETSCKGESCEPESGGDGDCKEKGCEEPEGETGGAEKGIPNPESTGVGVITAADWARVEARLNSTRNPAPDSGEIEISGPPPTVGPYDPTVALVNPDGVVVIAVNGNPTFNRANPEYDPTLNDVIGTAGVHPPVGNDPDPISWP